MLGGSLLIVHVWFGQYHIMTLYHLADNWAGSERAHEKHGGRLMRIMGFGAIPKRGKDERTH